MEKVVYFSLKDKNITDFDEITKTLRYAPKYSFDVVHKEDGFNNPRDLIPLIEDCTNKESLHVIIDYESLKGDDVDENDCAKVMRHIIMAYPEVQFLFDETKTNGKCFLTDFLFKDKTNDVKINQEFSDGMEGHVIDTKEFVVGKDNAEPLLIQVQPELHTICIDEEDDHFALLLVKGRNNLYDASNLRSTIKAVKRFELHVIDNYRRLTDSRRNNAAVVVDEEYNQNVFNSYCLYANGYRVFPIITATELKMINKSEKIIDALLIRDYDLQFIDEPFADSDETNEVDRIRGARLNKKTGEYELIEKNNSEYWRNFNDRTCYFLSKGGNGIKIELDNSDKRKPMMLTDNKHTLLLNGKEKPVVGIYTSMQKINVVGKRYKKTRYSKKDADYPIVTKRQGQNSHSCPLDVYDIARLMVQRSVKYYSDNKYRLAALVAREAIEILNGFHPSLMRRAYYVQALSENAMAMSLLGGEESKLVDDVNFRCEQIKEDIARMVPEKKDRINVINSIYDDCRVFCQKLEYLDAADEVLSFFVHENERLFK